MRAFDFLHQEIARTGVSHAEIATRTSKSRALISRLLGQPSNMTLDTMGELLFAVSGCELKMEASDPFAKHSPQAAEAQPTAS